MTTLTTPSEVAAFLAERVMGWTRCDVDHSAAGESHECEHAIFFGYGRWCVVHPEDEEDTDAPYWNPYRNVADAIEALEGWVCPYQAHYAIYANTTGEHTAKLYHSGRRVGIAHGRMPIAQIACHALCSALGATVEIDDE